MKRFLCMNDMPLIGYLCIDLLVFLFIILSYKTFIDKVHVTLNFTCIRDDRFFIIIPFNNTRKNQGIILLLAQRNEFAEKLKERFCSTHKQSLSCLRYEVIDSNQSAGEVFLSTIVIFFVWSSGPSGG